MKKTKINDEAANNLFDEFLDALEIEINDEKTKELKGVIVSRIKSGRVDFDLENYKAFVELKRPIGDIKTVTLSVDNATTGKVQEVAKKMQDTGSLNPAIILISNGMINEANIGKLIPSDCAALGALATYFLNY